KSVFGSPGPATADSVGGKAEFWDAVHCGPEVTESKAPLYLAGRMAAVSASVSINRRTRTAQDEQLRHAEFVPPGVRFRVTIAGQDMGDGEIDLLLRALRGFGDAEDSVTLGSDNADGH